MKVTLKHLEILRTDLHRKQLAKGVAVRNFHGVREFHDTCCKESDEALARLRRVVNMWTEQQDIDDVLLAYIEQLQKESA